jgi:hypothetical protein
MLNAALALVVGVVVFAGVHFYWEVSAHHPEARAELTHLVTQLRPRMSSDDVRRLFDAGGYGRLELHVVDGNRWLVRTPHSFGAQNWVLWLDFRGGVLVAARVRTADSVNAKPPGAPTDLSLEL